MRGCRLWKHSWSRGWRLWMWTHHLMKLQVHPPPVSFPGSIRIIFSNFCFRSCQTWENSALEYLVNSKNIKEYNIETNFALDFALLSHLQYRQWNGKLGKHFQIKIQFRLKACHRPSHTFLYFNCLEIYKPAEMQTGLVLRRALRKLSWGERTGNWNSKHLGRLWGQKMWNTLENCRKFGKEEKIRIFWFKPRRIVGTRDERIRAAQIQW